MACWMGGTQVGLGVLLDLGVEDQNYLVGDMALDMDLSLEGSPELEDMDLYFVDRAGILLEREKESSFKKLHSKLGN